MSNAAFVLIAIGVIIVVSVLLWLLNRKPQTFMSSIDDFEREMKALGGEAAKGGAVARQRRRAISPSSRRPSTPSGAPGAVEPGPVNGSRSSSTEAPESDGSEVSNGSNRSGSEEPDRSQAHRTGAGPADTSGEPQP